MSLAAVIAGVLRPSPRRTALPGWSARIIVSALLVPAPALAQSPPSAWGVVVSGTPNWSVADRTDYFFGGDEVVMDGSEFTIGLAHGRTLGGDWGVSYVRMKVNDGSTVSDVEVNCDTFTSCITFGEKMVTRDVVLNGLKVHKFISFGTIRQRVQIGLNLAAGVGTWRGEVDTHEYSFDQTFSPLGGAPIVSQTEMVTTEPAEALFFAKWVPVGDLQGAVSVILAPGLKIRVASGIGWPGDHTITLTGVYLIGAR